MLSIVGIALLPGRRWKLILLFLGFLWAILHISSNIQKVRRCVEEIRYPKWSQDLIEIFTKPVSLYDPTRECLICFETFEENSKSPRSIKCACTDNIYHEKCLTTWFEKSCSCPVCRKALDEKIHYL